MRQKFKTKDQTKKHRKSKHIKNTQFCNKYKSNRCPRSDDYCCYRQKETETSPESKANLKSEQVFCQVSQDLAPPDQIQRMIMNNLTTKMELMENYTTKMELMKNLTTKMELMEKRVMELMKQKINLIQNKIQTKRTKQKKYVKL